MRTSDLLPETQCWTRKKFTPVGILIHYISASRDHPDDPYNYDYIRDIFTKYGYSAHELILPNGDVKELVPIEYQAWHAGVSKYKTYKNLNKYFIGIEVAGEYGKDFTDAQYTELGSTINYHMQKYSIPTDMVKGHEDVSGPKVRKDFKTDPGPSMDWIRLGRLIERLNTGFS